MLLQSCVDGVQYCMNSGDFEMVSFPKIHYTVHAYKASIYGYDVITHDV